MVQFISLRNYYVYTLTNCLFTGDSLAVHTGKHSSTKDHDGENAGYNGAQQWNGAWWYTADHDSNLNALYLHGDTEQHGTSVTWKHWKGQNYSLKFTEMKIRPY